MAFSGVSSMLKRKKGFCWGEGTVGTRESNGTYPLLSPIHPALLVPIADGVKDRV